MVRADRISISKGRDLIIVYKIIALAAPIRSIWYPQPIMIKKIGINEISK